MSSKILILVAVVVLIGGVGLYLQNKPISHDQEINNNDQHVVNSDVSTEEIDFTDQSNVVIEIRNFKFADQVIKIKKGTTVTWTNFDSVEHNAMRDHEHDDHNLHHDHSLVLNGSGDQFNGPLLARGESWSYTFDEAPGTVSYHCGPHPEMTGKIIIVE